MVHWELIDRIVKAERLSSPTTNSEALRRHLEIWWCEKYSRPLKDPLLKEYTTDDLVYEFLTFYYRDPENDPKRKKAEAALDEDDRAWIDAQIAKAAKKPDKPDSPAPKAPSPGSSLDFPELSTRFDG